MKKKGKKTQHLGIIGGMGPIADARFLEILHTNTNALCDRGHIPVLYDGNCLRPDRSDFLCGKSGLSPFAGLKESLKFLEKQGCTVIVLPCNTAHFWYDELYRIKRKRTVLLNTVKTVCTEAVSMGISHPCLLCTEGTAKNDIYGAFAFKLGLDIVYPEKSIREEIGRIIKKIKAGKAASLDALIPLLEKIDCDGFILGCTELSIALKNTKKTPLVFIDSLEALAKTAVHYCGKKLRTAPTKTEETQPPR